MSARFSGRPLPFVASLATALILAALAFLTWVPVHRSPVQIVDPSDPGIAPEYDALLLRGQRDGGTYIITLVVAGAVQDSRYTVGVLVQDLGRPGETYVYDLEYQFGKEKNYGVPTMRGHDSLTFQFPLALLTPNTYVVGLDAVTWGPEGSDYVVEGPQEALRIERLLSLPIDPGLLWVASAFLGILTLILGVHAVDRFRRPDHDRR